MLEGRLRLLIEAVVLAVLAITALIYEKFAAHMALVDIVLLGFGAVFFIFLMVLSAAWIYSQPWQLLEGVRNALEEFKKGGDHLKWELETTLSESLESQPYVSEDMLAMIEEQADSIWVITTDLKNDVTVGSIRASVEKNLRTGKNYTYFIPSPTNPNFPNATQHYGAFKAWSVYREFSHQVRFIHLPDDTLFLFREVVIYNPVVDANAKTEKLPKGFTYFDTGADNKDRLMKVPETYLNFLRGQLHRYSEDVSLNVEVERLIIDLRGQLQGSEVTYLAGLLGERRIEDVRTFKDFIEGVRKHDTVVAEKLLKTLDRYKQPS